MAIENHNGKAIKPKLVRGNAWFSEDGEYIRMGEKVGVMCEHYTAKPGSVSLFLGYDKNGNEIYSDDVVADDEFSGEKDYAGNKILVGEIGNKFENLELVKE